MKISIFGRLRTILIAAVLATPFTSNSMPMIGLDMDPTTPGIQTSLSTTTSSIYTVDVVAWDDTLPPFTPLLVDTVAVDVVSTSAITSFAGSAIAGSFVGTFGGPLLPPPPPPGPAPYPGVPMLGGALDLAAGPISGGSPLVAGGAPGLTGGFSYSTVPLAGPLGSVGFGAGLLGASLAGATPANIFFSVLMTLTFSADAVGTTSLSVVDLLSGTSATGSLAYLPSLSAGGAPPGGYLSATSFVSTLTVTSPGGPPGPTPAPEPATLLLLALGLLGFRKFK